MHATIRKEGAEEDDVLHKVKISNDFYLSVTEVTPGAIERGDENQSEPPRWREQRLDISCRERSLGRCSRMPQEAFGLARREEG